MSSPYMVGSGPGAVETVLLNRCMESDSMYTVVEFTQISLLKLGLNGRWVVRAIFANVERRSSVLLPVRQSLLPFWWVKNIPVFS